MALTPREIGEEKAKPRENKERLSQFAGEIK
jgi:hypothetical protein